MYRADHVGSFLRPREVLDARRDPGITPEQIEEIEDRHIRRVLARQNDLGFRIFTDGELRRGGFMSDFYESIDGLDEDGSIARAWKGSLTGGAGATAAPSRLAGLVVSKIRQKQRLTGRESAFLKRASPGEVRVRSRRHVRAAALRAARESGRARSCQQQTSRLKSL